jgi:trehalose 6-phosphate phosphatase
MPTDSTAESAAARLLAPLRADPAHAAILTDVDGTLAPIVERPEQTSVPAAAQQALARLAGRFGVVGAVSGRRAAVARDLVGVEGIAYSGNHGLEVLPADGGPLRLDASLEGRGTVAAEHLAGIDPASLRAVGLRIEDKGPIQALHWRGAADEAAAEARAREVAAAAGAAGLEPHWGRKVLELRPGGGGGKGAAVSALIESGEGIAVAAYAGDDRTDLDAFRRLRQMRDDGHLELAVCVGVVSAEGPAEICAEADLALAGPGEWIEILRDLGG